PTDRREQPGLPRSLGGFYDSMGEDTGVRITPEQKRRSLLLYPDHAKAVVFFQRSTLVGARTEVHVGVLEHGHAFRDPRRQSISHVARDAERDPHHRHGSRE